MMFNKLGWYKKEKIILRISYLFLSVEDEISDAELTLLDDVGKSMENFSKMKEEVIDFCENLLSQASEDTPRFTIINKDFSSCKAYICSEPNSNRDILWMLINLLYRTKKRSEKHNKLIETWAEENQIDKSVVLEMYDTCETQNTIIEYQKWLEASKVMPEQESNSIMQELEKNQKSLEQSVSDLIALG